MKHLFLKLAQKYTQWIIVTWTIFLLVDLLLSKVAHIQTLRLTSIFGFAIAALVSAASLNATRWPMFWRRNSEDIRQFWVFNFAVLLFNLAVNVLCFFTIREIFKGDGFAAELFQISRLEFFWVFLITFSVSLVLLFDQKAMMANIALKPAKQVFLIFWIYVLLIVIFFLFMYSRLLGYAFAEATLVLFLLLKNNFVLGSISPPVRLRATGIGIFCVVILMGLSYFVEIRKAPEPSVFLGKIGPQKAWSFSELERIERPSQWISWFNSANNLDSSQMVKALEKLEALCPPAPTDYPTIIQCFEPTSEEQRAYIKGKSEETEILNRMNSQTLYVRLVGLVGAREIDELSLEIRAKLEEIKSLPGRLGLVAEKTLADHKKANQAIVQVVTRKAQR